MNELGLSQIRLDGGTQSRAQLSEEAIDEYAERYAEGAPMPPVVVFHDGAVYWLADGFHRCAGAVRAGKDTVPVEVKQGTQRDAILYSVGANSKHGLRRTNADKRRAVEMLLRDEEWAKKSDRWIAEQCGVSDPFVGKLREALQTVSNAPAPTTRETKDGRQYPTERRASAPSRESSPDDAGLPAAFAPPDEAKWWECPNCASVYNHERSVEYGWVTRGFCDNCIPVVREDAIQDDVEPAKPQPMREPEAVPLTATVGLERLEALAFQRNIDPEFASLRAAQRAVGAAMPSRAQRMVEFVLDGGDIALVRLGLDWTVDEHKLKQAYKAASLQTHPDRGGSSEDFVRVNRAHQLIKAMLGVA